MTKFVIFLITLLYWFHSANAGCFLNYYLEDCRYTNLYNFGPLAGDKNISKHDDDSVFIEKPVNFKFFDQYFTSFHISTNGVVKLTKTNDSFKSHELFDPQLFPVLNEPLIAPFWTDMIPDSQGDIFYRLVTDNETLDKVSSEINPLRQNRTMYKPSWASVITWFQLKAFNHRRFDYNNTFQLVLTTDGSQSYIMFNYGRLNWPNSKVRVNVISGYNLGDNSSFFQMDDSFTPNITNLELNSNVGVRSKWIFRVDTHSVEVEYAQYAAHQARLKENKIVKKKQIDPFLILLFVVILIGINSLINTGLWMRKCLKKNKYRPRLQMAYNKHLNDSTMILTQEI